MTLTAPREDAIPPPAPSAPRDPVVRYVCPRDNYVAVDRAPLHCPICGREMR